MFGIGSFKPGKMWFFGFSKQADGEFDKSIVAVTVVDKDHKILDVLWEKSK